VRDIVRTLEEAGHETWAVGGAVRDVLMGRPSGDWDLATSARPKQVRRLFRRTVPIGIEHGTVGVLGPDGTLYELTTFRRDVETDGRHAVVAFADRIEEDLARRDFTVNAIAWHPLREVLLDPFDGVSDLEARTLRTVGEPGERFREDHLRILRALRFAGLFGFAIDVATWEAIRRGVGELPRLSAERIRDELIKVLDADPVPSASLELYAASGALMVLYPELGALMSQPAARGASRPERLAAAAGEVQQGAHHVGAPSAWALSVASVDELPRGRPLLRLAALARDLAAKDVAAMLVRLRFSNAQVDETAHRAGAAPLPAASADDRAFRHWLSGCGPTRIAALARLDLARAKAAQRLGLDGQVDGVVASWRKAKAVRAARPPLDVAALALDGRALIQLGLRPGPHFGRILAALLDWVLDDPTRNRRELLAERALQLAGEEGP
jgi:tRNA nucleotidyltransferase (CCA-adding enzyme)